MFSFRELLTPKSQTAPASEVELAAGGTTNPRAMARRNWGYRSNGESSATAARCVDLIANSIAAMGVDYQRKTARGVFRDYSQHPNNLVLNIEPNGVQTAFDFWREVVRKMLLDGVCVVVPTRRAGDEISSLEIATGEPLYEQNSKTWLVSTDPARGAKRYKESEVLVFRHRWNFETSTSRAFSTVASDALELDEAGNQECLDRLDNGGVPLLILSGESVQTGTYGPGDKNLKSLALKIDNMLKGRVRAMAIRGGIKATPVNSSAVDMQLLPVREFAVKEICRFMGVPPMFVYTDSNSNYKSVEMAYIDLLTNTLDPIMRGIENELLRKLVPRVQWLTRRYRFNRSARQMADLNTQAAWLGKMQGIGAMSVNDIRSMCDFDPVEGGDGALISANLRPLNE